MRLAAFALIACLPVSAMAQDTAAAAESSMSDFPIAGIMFNTSISINAPLTATDRAGKAAEEEAYRKDLYQRSVGECVTLMDTIATKCEVTSVNVSTQINSNPGQPDYLYATSNITMQVELK
ncbi:hypothetical protein [Tabrizicola sp.]|uniref:hypothetical protein n=1 Tax=Tabrizicola sp. TaxID=2005166 RepID=UPI003F404084